MLAESPALPRPEFISVDQNFQKELNRRVSGYFRSRNISPKAGTKIIFKAALLYTLLASIYVSFFSFEQNLFSAMALATTMAALLFLIGMNVMHDCAHGTLFKNPLLTKIGYRSWDLFGVSGDIYRVKHLEAHHEFTNVTGWDGDMDLPYPFLRLNPNLPPKPHHRFQPFYAPLLYSLVTLSWIFFEDFKVISSQKVCNLRLKPLKRIDITQIFLFKAINLFMFIILPCLFFPLLKVLGIFIYVQILLGFLLSLIFQVAHINEKTKFLQAHDGTVASDWAIHQLATSCNFATASPFWKFALGGLNYQIEHHLFPTVSHVHYPEIQNIVRTLCAESHLPYHEFATFGEAITSHFRQLQKLGRNPLTKV